MRDAHSSDTTERERALSRGFSKNPTTETINRDIYTRRWLLYYALCYRGRIDLTMLTYPVHDADIAFELFTAGKWKKKTHRRWFKVYAENVTSTNGLRIAKHYVPDLPGRYRFRQRDVSRRTNIPYLSLLLKKYWSLRQLYE